LHIAAQYGLYDAAALMLSYGAYVNAQNDVGRTPLHYAVDNGHKDFVKLLFSRNAIVNAKDNNGTTPLHLAQYGHEDMVDLLRNHGAYER
jgi:ankyrin repeat protein